MSEHLDCPACAGSGWSDDADMADGTIRVTVAVDTDELRHWADRHADAGHHGVAHVLYKAATDGESLTEQAMGEARREGAVAALNEAADDVFDTALPAEAAHWLRERAQRIGGAA